ncbi:MAG: hypothetical protein [Olavius algarvensis spirochete endosymbiont]|nr:MAG: hypothetical protein [Olavius algarvensis spirochete endosymbiont]
MYSREEGYAHRSRFLQVISPISDGDSVLIPAVVLSYHI